jgi:hypothetical protein
MNADLIVRNGRLTALGSSNPKATVRDHQLGLQRGRPQRCDAPSRSTNSEHRPDSRW